MDGPGWQAFFVGLIRRVCFGHMSGLFARVTRLALMISDNPAPYHRGELDVHDEWRGVLDFRRRPFWIITS